MTVTFDPTQQVYFGGHYGTMSADNLTYQGYDFGSGVAYKTRSTEPLTAPIGTVRFTYVPGLSEGQFGLVQTDHPMTYLFDDDGYIGTLGQRSNSWGVRRDGGGVALIVKNGGYQDFPPTITAKGILLVHRDSKKAWLVYADGSIKPDTPTFGVDGSLLSGNGYDTGLVGDIYFAVNTSQDDGWTVEASGIDTPLPDNVPTGWNISAPVLEKVYQGAIGRAARVLGSRTDQQLYLGSKALF